MTNLMINFLSFLILFSFSVDSIVAQDSQSQLYLMHSVKIQPSKKATYEKAVKAVNASMRKANVSTVEWYGNSTDNYEYHYALPLENLAQLDEDYFAEAIKIIGEEKFKKERAAVIDCVMEEINTLYVHVKDFNYSHASLKDTKMNYRKWDLYEFKPGTKQEDVNALVMEWKALLKKHDVVRRQSVYLGSIGTKTGTMVILTDAKDAAAYAQYQKELWEKTGKEGRDLWARTEAAIEKMEFRTGRMRPDLSVIPTTEDAKPLTAEKE